MNSTVNSQLRKTDSDHKATNRIRKTSKQKAHIKVIADQISAFFIPDSSFRLCTVNSSSCRFCAPYFSRYSKRSFRFLAAVRPRLQRFSLLFFELTLFISDFSTSRCFQFVLFFPEHLFRTIIPIRFPVIFPQNFPQIFHHNASETDNSFIVQI